MSSEILNIIEINKAVQVLKPDDQLFECRIIYNSKVTYSGYFHNASKLLEAFEGIHDFANCNIYFTLNTINEQCYTRTQKDKFVKNAEATTSDNDITGYDWLLIDLDPRRPTKTSSTSAQIEKTRILSGRIIQYLQNVGFEAPVIAFSGNGYHMLYKLYMTNTAENKKLLEMVLKTLNMLFADDEIDVDMKNFNPSRICKLYGTRAQKGIDADGNSHRMSCIVQIPEIVKITDKRYLEKLVEIYPKPEKPQMYNGYRPSEFDLDSWLSKYDIKYTKASYQGGEKYILDHCVFDPNHKGKDAVIFRNSDGSLAYHCFHASCSDKHWRDVRLLFEPSAYERRQQDYEKRIYSKARAPAKKIEAKEDEPVWFTAKDILNRPKAKETFIRTGTVELDKRLRGLKIGATSVLSGLRGSAKSTWLSGLVLECCQNGNNVGVFSGELSAENFMRWTNLQAAGKGNIEATQFQNYYNVSTENQRLIAEWMGKKFCLYNNKYGNDFRSLKEEFQKKIESDRLELLILDNLMAFDISGLSDSKYEAQTAFVWSLHELANEANCHILFVAHPRKAMGFLRLDDISGTADIGNAVDNAFIIHRNNNDFMRLSKQMFGWKEDNEIYKATNVIEIAKDRDGGNQDIFIPLWYEPETKRLKNQPTENKVYGWDKKADDFIQVPDTKDIVFD